MLGHEYRVLRVSAPQNRGLQLVGLGELHVNRECRKPGRLCLLVPLLQKAYLDMLSPPLRAKHRLGVRGDLPDPWIKASMKPM